MEKLKRRYSKAVNIWLLIGLIMLIGQVVLGGITRLTGSGLSITRWDIITGVIPPLNPQQWVEAFELYKETPQFQKINSTFTLQQFKFIYFWEYFHRLWVRALGFIFLIPFIYFLLKKKIDFYLVKRLMLVIALTLLTASAGWIMVQSGLVNRPWVNAYKLTIHFMLALLVLWAMLKTIVDAFNYKAIHKIKGRRWIFIVLSITFLQMIFAGLMAGMKAGLYYPTWPDMNGAFIPEVLTVGENWKTANLINYDSYLFTPALVQFTHRMLAYLLVVLTLLMFYKLKNKLNVQQLKWLYYSLWLVIIQVVLGVLTVLNVAGEIPLFLGVSHQLVGVLYFLSLLLLKYTTQTYKI